MLLIEDTQSMKGINMEELDSILVFSRMLTKRHRPIQNPSRIESSSSMFILAISQPDSPPEPFVMIYLTESSITELSAFRLFGKFSMKGGNEKFHFIRLQTMDCKRSIVWPNLSYSTIPSFVCLKISKAASPKYLMVGKRN